MLYPERPARKTQIIIPAGWLAGVSFCHNRETAPMKRKHHPPADEQRLLGESQPITRAAGCGVGRATRFEASRHTSMTDLSASGVSGYKSATPTVQVEKTH
jgi:hypothetical protein